MPGLRQARRRWCGSAAVAGVTGRRCCCRAEIQAILDGCAVFDEAAGSGRLICVTGCCFLLLAESGMRLGEALGMRISDFVMGRGGTGYVEIVPRLGQSNGARVKMMRPAPGLCQRWPGAAIRRLPDPPGLPGRRAGHRDHCGLAAAGNLQRPPLLAALGEGTIRDKVTALRRKGIGPPGWTPHWFRHSHATALLLAGTPDWVVSRRLGHAHVQTTLDLYGWVREDEALRAAANWRSYAAGWQVNGER